MIVIVAVGYFIGAIMISVKHHCQDIIPLICLVALIMISVTVWFIRKRCTKQLASCTECFGSVIGQKARKALKMYVLMLSFMFISNALKNAVIKCYILTYSKLSIILTFINGTIFAKRYFVSFQQFW